MRKSTSESTGPVGVTDTGLVHLRSLVPITRRAFGKGALAAAGAATAGLPIRRASAATGVKYMGWQGYDEVANFGGFLDEQDARLDTTYIGSPEEVVASFLAGGKGSMDLCTPGALQTEQWVRAGVLEPLDTDKIPNLAGLFPEFQNMSDFVVDGRQYGVPFSWGSFVIMWRIGAIENEPTSWMDLFKEEYKGKVIAPDDMWALFPAFANAVTGEKRPTRLTREELDELIDLVIRFKKEHVLTLTTWGDVGAMLASGDADIAIASEAMYAWAGYPPLKWITPDEGTFTFVDAWAILADPPHRELSHAILNHVLSPGAQAHMQNINAAGTVVEAAVPLLSEQAATIFPFDDIESYWEKSGGLSPMYPLDPGGPYVTFDEVIEGWEQVLRA